MSFNRENVTWQSEDGTWNLGFLETLWVGHESDGYDPEWDVEYGSDFWWVTTGHATEKSARDVWDGGNPGGSNVVRWSPESADECARYDDLAKKAESTDVTRLRQTRVTIGSGGLIGYSGTW